MTHSHFHERAVQLSAGCDYHNRSGKQCGRFAYASGRRGQAIPTRLYCWEHRHHYIEDGWDCENGELSVAAPAAYVGRLSSILIVSSTSWPDGFEIAGNPILAPAPIARRAAKLKKPSHDRKKSASTRK